MKWVIFSLICGVVLSGQAAATNTNAVTLTFTNGPAQPFWAPTAEQKKIEGEFFKTEVNKFDEVVTHRLISPCELLYGTTFAVRRWSATKDEYLWGMTRRGSSLTHLDAFDESGALKFVVDNRRWVFTNETAVTEFNVTSDLDLLATYLYPVSRELIEALGRCKTASVRLPTRGGNLDYDFTPTELKRYALFYRAYVASNGPATTISIKK